MRNRAKRICLWAAMVVATMPCVLHGQISVQIQEEGHYYYPPVFFEHYSGLTPAFDALGRDVVYLASNEKGLVTFDVSVVGNPHPVDSMPPSAFGGAKIMSLCQRGAYLYLATGSFWQPQDGGLAIADVSNPLQPLLLGRWDSTAFDQGCAHVTVEGDYAYLAMMERGVVILDIHDPAHIHFVSHILPDPNFGPPPYAPNARGLSIDNDTLMVAYDAGGLRMIDVTVKTQPQEIGKYVNASLSAVANPAYNNILRIGNYVWVPVDYCGLEVVDVSDPAHMQSFAWYNPWGCNNLQSGHQWIGADYHLNEIALVAQDSIVYVSGGDREVIAFDARHPQQLIPLTEYGPDNDTIVAWGIAARAERIAVGIQYNLIELPNRSKVGGLRMLHRDLQTHAIAPESPAISVESYPVPVQASLHMRLLASEQAQAQVGLYNLHGIQVWGPKRMLVGPEEIDLQIDCHDLPPGTYLLRLDAAQQRFARLIVVSH